MKELIITEKDRQDLIRLKDAVQKLKVSATRLSWGDYPNIKVAETMIKMGMYLYMSIYKQLSDEFKNQYHDFNYDINLLFSTIEFRYGNNRYRIDIEEEILLDRIIEFLDSKGI